ncbi:DnaB-like helicase N-terminal domain-containing protein [Williamsia sp. D3]|uniref:DnaB-like helicase N-terminal domain-containing protein n=1 Tax=Williamsia TaxID=85043 RepID=UPI0003D3ACBD|nr:DnaB-like helicase N-terminal domain-containing protein [Williamsia sp. D3]ETD34334.1 hypothetical protein W823_03010 [Williamsia sp. D3]
MSTPADDQEPERSAQVLDLYSGNPPGPELVEDRDPAEQAESFFLCALMWADRPTALAATDHVRASDFYGSAAAEVFGIIRQILTHGGDESPHTAVAVLGELRRRGQAHTASQLTMLLSYVADTATAANPWAQGPEITGVQAPAYAAEVLALAYRRLYRTAGEGLITAAETLPEDDLFEYMATHGRHARDLRDRLAAVRAGGLTDEGAVQ